jgi:hypothetical protein
MYRIPNANYDHLRHVLPELEYPSELSNRAEKQIAICGVKGRISLVRITVPRWESHVDVEFLLDICR